MPNTDESTPPHTPHSSRSRGNSIVTGLYSGNAYDFLLSLENASGVILECNMTDPSNTPRVISTLSTDVSSFIFQQLHICYRNKICTALRFSRSGNFLLCGSNDGSVLVLNSTSRTPNWRTFLHSSGVRGIASSFDDSYILSVGEDGNFFAGYEKR